MKQENQKQNTSNDISSLITVFKLFAFAGCSFLLIYILGGFLMIGGLLLFAIREPDCITKKRLTPNILINY